MISAGGRLCSSREGLGETEEREGVGAREKEKGIVRGEERRGRALSAARRCRLDRRLVALERLSARQVQQPGGEMKGGKGRGVAGGKAQGFWGGESPFPVLGCMRECV